MGDTVLSLADIALATVCVILYAFAELKKATVKLDRLLTEDDNSDKF